MEQNPYTKLSVERCNELFAEYAAACVPIPELLVQRLEAEKGGVDDK